MTKYIIVLIDKQDNKFFRGAGGELVSDRLDAIGYPPEIAKLHRENMERHARYGDTLQNIGCVWIEEVELEGSATV